MLTILRVWRVVVLLTWTVLLAPLQFASVVLHLPTEYGIPLVFHRFVARVFRIAIVVRGTPSTERPTLYIANHSSWLDIVLMSTVVPVSFVAKSEIARWPGFSILAKLQRSVFIERRREKAREGVSDMNKRLAAGDNLVLFAEGHSGDGNSVDTFKSSMFSTAEIDLGNGRRPVVQPVSIAYTHLDGFPLGRRSRHKLTWYGKMSLPTHLWQVLGQGHARVVLQFHTPVRAADFASRKELAAYCQRVVSESHARAISGRLDVPASVPVPAAATPTPALPPPA